VGPGRPGSDSPTFLRGLSVPALIAHEYAHAVQQMAGLVLKETPTIVTEQQADCLSGVYLRWVAEGHCPRFTVSTGDGLDRVLAGLITIRDPETPEDTELASKAMEQLRTGSVRLGWALSTMRQRAPRSTWTK
jgi:hypothetical protein